ncbi:uncharacterized protein LOC106177074 [Lingula anatina]|uniref:Uncharacterized protein LOC106177074 n=1 Tax=Lingula anatina TaxID=7574 RepID=A0A1S3JY08_LINAN|nr:uncharacterized protein LOC106177074 [Lingula anatina]|eukprot:XP_013415192.1 uncharacterized protein LOC106177074 [Lingula anatina]
MEKMTILRAALLIIIRLAVQVFNLEAKNVTNQHEACLTDQCLRDNICLFNCNVSISPMDPVVLVGSNLTITCELAPRMIPGYNASDVGLCCDCDIPEKRLVIRARDRNPALT